MAASIAMKAIKNVDMEYKVSSIEDVRQIAQMYKDTLALRLALGMLAEEAYANRDILERCRSKFKECDRMHYSRHLRYFQSFDEMLYYARKILSELGDEAAAAAADANRWIWDVRSCEGSQKTAGGTLDCHVYLVRNDTESEWIPLDNIQNLKKWRYAIPMEGNECLAYTRMSLEDALDELQSPIDSTMAHRDPMYVNWQMEKWERECENERAEAEREIERDEENKE